MINITRAMVKNIVCPIVGSDAVIEARDVSQLEADSLVAFYLATGGHNWANNEHWLDSTIILKWFGLSYDIQGADFLEIESLKQFYFSTSGDCWILKDKWFNPIAINLWNGIYSTSELTTAQLIALNDFYRETGGRDWTSDLGWFNEDSADDWLGITLTP